MAFEELPIFVFRQFAKFFRIREDGSCQGRVVAAVVRVIAGRIAVITRMGVVRLVSVGRLMWPMAVVGRMRRRAFNRLVRLAAVAGRMWRTVVRRAAGCLGRVPARFPAVRHLPKAGWCFGGRSAHWDRR